MVRALTLILASVSSLALLASAVLAQPASAPASDIPMADYLGLLAQIAPAARDGAETYLQAFERRCGRVMNAAQLRRAMADGNGDPVLMGMIRASQLRDAKAIGELSERIDCGGRR